MASAPRIGTEFAGYRIEGLLGRGGMGVVYRAEHPRLGATIALKVMESDLATDEVFRERFVREARVAARIRHPNIIPIYDAGEWHGDLYMAMRYVEGEDLRSLLRKNGALTQEQTYVIGLQIASALDAAHRSGLIHRDIKPGNILIEPGPDPGSKPIAYLADLGLTKHVDSNSGGTGTGELLGTIDYIAPEQISGSHVDGRADVYSLACVLFECLTGTVPYVRENQAAVLWAHLHDDVPRATTVNPALSETIADALARGMAKSPDDRYSTGRELVAALDAPLEAATAVGRGGASTRPIKTRTSAPQPPTATPTGRRVGRRALAVAAAVGVLLGAAAAGAAALLISDGQTDGQTPARRTTPEGSAAADGQTPARRTTPEGSAAASSLASLTPFDRELLRHVPDELQTSCRHARPLTPDFDSTLSCRPDRVGSSLTYSHARSGFLLHNFLVARMTRAGLTPTEPLTLSGLCGTGEIPSVNSTVAAGLSGRMEVQEIVSRDERLGYVLCYRRAGQARIEWTTNEIAVYAALAGEELPPLYDWWRTEAGPEP